MRELSSLVNDKSSTNSFCFNHLLLTTNNIAFAKNKKQPTTSKNNSEVKMTDQKKRDLLWKSFLKGYSKEAQKINVYAENSSFTMLCFSISTEIYLYELTENKLEEVIHAKELPLINRITYETNKNMEGSFFILWRNGKRELAIGVVE